MKSNKSSRLFYKKDNRFLMIWFQLLTSLYPSGSLNLNYQNLGTFRMYFVISKIFLLHDVYLDEIFIKKRK